MGKRTNEVTQVVLGELAFSLSLSPLPSPPLSSPFFFPSLSPSSLPSSFFFFPFFFTPLFGLVAERSGPSTGEADRMRSLTVPCQ